MKSGHSSLLDSSKDWGHFRTSNNTLEGSESRVVPLMEVCCLFGLD